MPHETGCIARSSIFAAAKVAQRRRIPVDGGRDRIAAAGLAERHVPPSARSLYTSRR
jgi:hypothetical protein